MPIIENRSEAYLIYRDSIMYTLEDIHALTKRDESRLQELKRIVKIKMKKEIDLLKISDQKDDILYMNDRNKNNTERGSTMKLITENFKKAFYLASASLIVYAIVKAFIMADGFANSL